MDATGSLIVSMRENAALELSGLASRNDFVYAHANDNISFPVLASTRVHLTRRKNAAESEHRGDAFLDAVLLEAEEQDIEIVPTSALLAWRPVLKGLSGTEDVKIAGLREISAMPHVGMAVSG